MNYYLHLLIVVYGYMLCWFLVSIVKKRNDVADIAWGMGFVLLSWYAFFLAEPSTKALLMNLLVTIWGGRLAWHIYQRNKKKTEDARYLAWRNSWKHFYLRSFFQIYLLQGTLLYIIALPVVYSNSVPTNGVSITDCVGILVWCIGFFFEVVGDHQLKVFLSNPSNKGKIMDQGLWQYTRHPNYFGEVTMWWGLCIVALSSPGAYITIIGPLTITVLILFVSGIPLLEKKYAGRPDFESYKRKTSVFFPLPRKMV